MTWSASTLARAHDLIAAYPQKRSAVMPLLYLAMVEDGYLTQEGMRQVADLVGITPAQVQAVASFYTMYKREPVGRYLISVCTSISCFLLGSDGVLRAVEGETGVPDGETAADGSISVEHVECIGACGGAPALQVNYEFVEGVTPDKARGLCRWLSEAQPESIKSDELQALFGGKPSFEWAIKEESGAVGPIPAFPPLGTVTR